MVLIYVLVIWKEKTQSIIKKKKFLFQKNGLKKTENIYYMNKNKLPKPKPIGLQHIELVLKSRKIPFVTEHKFMDERKFRFDIAMPEKKIAIEYEGLENKQQGRKSRHTTNVGYSNDCLKYNLAIVNGWKVLSLSAPLYRLAGFM